MKIGPIYVLSLLSTVHSVAAVMADGQTEISHKELVEMVFQIQNENVQVHREMAVVQRKMAEVRREKVEVHREIVKVQREMAEVRRENADLKNENEVIKSKFVELGRVVTNIESDTSELLNNMTTLNHNVNDTHNELTAASDRDSGYTMFSVAAERPESYVNEETMIFHHMFSDVKPSGTGGGWDPNSHRYVCPISGHYLFMVTIFKYDSPDYNEFRVSLKRASDRLTVISVYKNSASEPRMYWSNTAHVIAPCSAGEEVYLSAIYPCNLYDDGGHYNQFSGVLLKPGL